VLDQLGDEKPPLAATVVARRVPKSLVDANLGEHPANAR